MEEHEKYSRTNMAVEGECPPRMVKCALCPHEFESRERGRNICPDCCRKHRDGD